MLIRSYRSRFDVDVHPVADLAPLRAQNRRAEEEARRAMPVPPPPVHLAHEVHRCLGGTVVQHAERIRSRSGIEQAGGECLLRLVMVFAVRKCGDIAYSCWEKKNTY